MSRSVDKPPKSGPPKSGPPDNKVPVTGSRMRLDVALPRRGLAQSRARARDLVVRGQVTVGGQPIMDPAKLVSDGDALAVTAARQWASRGAEKLVAALDGFGIDVSGRTALDLGASTGGFTDVLLVRGARRVYAVDVGRDQLIPRLAHDPRVVAHQAIDARLLDERSIPEPIDVLAADVSFISLTKVLPNALRFVTAGGDALLLVKPQFEVGREHIGKGGIVRDAAQRQRALDLVIATIERLPTWRIAGHRASPITGGDGNCEWLLWAQHT